MQEDIVLLEASKNSASNAGVLPEIAKLDFARIKYKMALKESLGWTSDKIDLAEQEYKRYLSLIKLHPKQSIVPSKIMDEFWHMHILDTKAYREDCQKIFGYFVDHFPYFGIYGQEDRQKLVDSFEETKRLYRKTFGVEMKDASASRCEDHACHVTSDCACRTSSACKAY